MAVLKQTNKKILSRKSTLMYLPLQKSNKLKLFWSSPSMDGQGPGQCALADPA